MFKLAPMMQRALIALVLACIVIATAVYVVGCTYDYGAGPVGNSDWDSDACCLGRRRVCRPGRPRPRLRLHPCYERRPLGP